MADLSRADELVQTMERDGAFRAAVEAAAPAAKRRLLDERGFADVGLDDMRAYVQSKGGRLEVQAGGRELSEDELAAVAGGLTSDEQAMIAIGVGAGVYVAAAASAAAA